MNEMIEDVALAIGKAEGCNVDPRRRYTKAARAGIEMMREPTPDMVSAAMHKLSELPDEAGWPDLARASANIWRTMIDAALKDTPRS